MNKKQFTKRLRDDLLVRQGGEGKGWHSRAYHRFFEGYREQEVVDERGKVHIQRIYCGVWYSRDLTRGQNLRQNLVYVLLWLLALAGAVFLASRDYPINRTWYAALCQLLSVVGMAWVFGGFFRSWTSPRQMTVADYKASSMAIRRGSLFTVAVLTLTAGVTLVHGFLVDAMEALIALGYAVPILLLLLLNRLEANLPYTETLSQAEADPEAVEIE